jgi:hypothetical protein
VPRASVESNDDGSLNLNPSSPGPGLRVCFPIDRPAGGIDSFDQHEASLGRDAWTGRGVVARMDRMPVKRHRVLVRRSPFRDH